MLYLNQVKKVLKSTQILNLYDIYRFKCNFYRILVFLTYPELYFWILKLI
jgi:hypothetical protein